MLNVVSNLLWTTHKAVKMGWNPWANPIHHGLGLGWVEFFLQILIRVDFLPGSPRIWLTRIEPVVSRIGLQTRK